MYTCILCHFKTELDDVAIAHGSTCVCLRCYGRETDSLKPMTPELRKLLIEALAQPDPA